MPENVQVISLSHDSGDLSDEVDAHVTCARLRVRRCEGSEATSSVEAAMGAARNEGGLIEAKAMMGMAKVLQAKEEMTAARSLGKICFFLCVFFWSCSVCFVLLKMRCRPLFL